MKILILSKCQTSIYQPRCYQTRQILNFLNFFDGLCRQSLNLLLAIFVGKFSLLLGSGVAQLVERSPLTPEIRGWNPVIGQTFIYRIKN